VDISDFGDQSAEHSEVMPDEFLPQLIPAAQTAKSAAQGRFMRVVDRLEPRPLIMVLPNQTADQAGLVRRAREIAYSVGWLESRLAMKPVDRIDLTYRTTTPDAARQYATIERQGRVKSFRVLRVNEGLVQSDGVQKYASTFNECVLAGSFYRSDRTLDVALANAAVRDTLRHREQRRAIGVIGSVLPVGVFGGAAVNGWLPEELAVAGLAGLAVGMLGASHVINRDIAVSEADRVDVAIGTSLTGQRVAASAYFQTSWTRSNMAWQRFNIRPDDSSAAVVAKLATAVLLSECDWPEIETGLRAILRKGPSIADLD
jgi:hypothetical protein